MKLCKQRRVKIKDGRTVLLRRPEMKDVRQLMEYINAIIDEDAPISLTKKLTPKQEKAFVKNVMEGLRAGTIHFVLAELDGRIVGAANINAGSGRHSHVGEYGISVAKDFRRLGVASAMTKYILGVSRRDKKLKVIMLRVYEFNNIAMPMYRKFGFRKVARLKRRVMYKGKLLDEFVMDLKR
ncbi:MAG: GNAT family N-acetyltransferase [Candidatus Aenigmatarchaeota archaeon]